MIKHINNRSVRPLRGILTTQNDPAAITALPTMTDLFVGQASGLGVAMRRALETKGSRMEIDRIMKVWKTMSEPTPFSWPSEIVSGFCNDLASLFSL